MQKVGDINLEARIATVGPGVPTKAQKIARKEEQEAWNELRTRVHTFNGARVPSRSTCCMLIYVDADLATVLVLAALSWESREEAVLARMLVYLASCFFLPDQAEEDLEVRMWELLAQHRRRMVFHGVTTAACVTGMSRGTWCAPSVGWNAPFSACLFNSGLLCSEDLGVRVIGQFGC